MDVTLGFCLALAYLTEAEWHPVRQEMALAKVPPRKVLYSYWQANKSYREELVRRLAILPGDQGAREALERARRIQLWIDLLDHYYGYGLEPDEARNPWVRLYYLRQVREVVGDGPFYNGPWPGPLPLDCLPWWDHPRGAMLGVPEP